MATTQVILCFNAESFLEHFHDQEGEIEELSAMLREKAHAALDKVNFRGMADIIVVFDGKRNVFASQGVEDVYAFKNFGFRNANEGDDTKKVNI